MANTFKVLSALLSYPSAEIQEAVPELRECLATERLVVGSGQGGLDALLDEVAATDLMELQERYLVLFDRTRSLSLYLFEHVHGESRDRGQAMIDLAAQYEKAGLVVRPGELPDFLPMFLEFLAMLPLDEAREMLGQTAHILAAVAERLRKRGSSYAAVYEALGAIASEVPAADAVAGLLQEPDQDPNDLHALDVAWAEEPVTFGPAATACKDGLVARVRAARRPAAAFDPIPAARRDAGDVAWTDRS